MKLGVDAPPLVLMSFGLTITKVKSNYVPSQGCQPASLKCRDRPRVNIMKPMKHHWGVNIV